MKIFDRVAKWYLGILLIVLSLVAGGSGFFEFTPYLLVTGLGFIAFAITGK